MDRSLVWRRCGVLSWVLSLVAVLWAGAAWGQAPAAKNVILFIADGGGFNHYAAASMYQGRWDAQAGRGTQLYDQKPWIQLACSTYPLNVASIPTRGQAATLPDKVFESATKAKGSYDPAQAWDPADGYRYLRTGYTDSAASATALATGVKTYNSAINWSDDDQPLVTLPELAKRAGKSVGTVSTMPLSHATPACFGMAHQIHRNRYAAIAQDMLASQMDVIMGAGHPEFDNAGRPYEGVDAAARTMYVGGEESWARLKAGQWADWTLVQKKEEFESLAQAARTPTRVLGLPQVFITLQAVRAGQDMGHRLDTVPDLATMTRAALNVLDNNPRGFFVMIEAGAVDQAAHAGNLGRMIEEQIDFNQAVEAVAAYLHANTSGNNWDNTLVILTADHETGLLWGPNSREPGKAFEPLEYRGPGVLPGAAFVPAKPESRSYSHSNSLVPVYARGPGAQLLVKLADQTDPRRGPYLDNIEIFQAMRAAMTLGD